MSISYTLKALSDVTRRKILKLLTNGKMSAGDLSNQLRISPGTLSYHLSSLKKANLIVEYKFKNFIFYELNTTVFNELIIWLKEFEIV